MVEKEFKNLILVYEVSNLETDGSGGYIFYQRSGPILVNRMELRTLEKARRRDGVVV